MSFGSGMNDAVNDATKHAVEEGMTVVVSAGNEDRTACELSPAGVEEVITVGSIDQNDTRAPGSSWGECLDIFAPGVGILSAFMESDTSYATMSGTSMASPYVAGLVTYLISREGNLTTPALVRDRIIQLATKDKVKDPMGSPNLIAFKGNAEEL